MTSIRESRFTRYLRDVFPYLYKTCPEGNHHWYKDRICGCRLNEFSLNWHGGYYDFETSQELVPYIALLKLQKDKVALERYKVLNTYETAFVVLTELAKIGELLVEECKEMVDNIQHTIRDVENNKS